MSGRSNVAVACNSKAIIKIIQSGLFASTTFSTRVTATPNEKYNLKLLKPEIASSLYLLTIMLSDVCRIVSLVPHNPEHTKQAQYYFICKSVNKVNAHANSTKITPIRAGQ